MLKVDIQAHGFDLTPAIEDQIEKAAGKIAKIDEKAQSLTVYLEIEKRKAENGSTATFKIARPGKDIFVKESRDNLYDCLSALTKSALEDLRREKEREQTY